MRLCVPLCVYKGEGALVIALSPTDRVKLPNNSLIATVFKPASKPPGARRGSDVAKCLRSSICDWFGPANHEVRLTARGNSSFA